MENDDIKVKTEAAEGPGQDANFKSRPKRQSGKRSKFLARAKKLGQKGKLGKGYHIDEETYNYYVRVFELLNKNEFDNEDEKDTFIENSLAQTENEEHNLSRNQMTSRVLEMLLSVATKSDGVLKFASALTEHLRIIVIDPYASHVVEKLFEVISLKWRDDKKLMKWFRKTSLFVLNNFEEFLFNTFANHTMRRAIQCLGATSHLFPKMQQMALTPLTPANQYKHNPEKIEKAILTKKGKKLLLEFAERFLSWPQFNDLLQSELTSGFIQCLLITLKEVEADDLFSQGVIKTKNIIKSDLILSNPIHAHTLENCFVVANEELFLQLYNEFCKGKILSLAKHEHGHFLVEKMLTLSTNKELFEEIFDEICDHFQEIYDAGFYSVFVSLVEGCKKNDSKQGPFFNQLKDIKTENENNNWIQKFIHFGKPRKGQTGYLTDIHGTIIIQNLLEFHKPTKVVNSLLELDGGYIKTLANDPKGSHVIQNYFKSPQVSEKNREALLTKIEDYLQAIACSKFGSRIIDEIWSSCSIKCKSIVASNLSKRISQLNGDKFGKFISEKYSLHIYKRDATQWSKLISNQNDEPENDNKGSKKKKRAISELMSNINGAEIDSLNHSKGKKKKENV